MSYISSIALIFATLFFLCSPLIVWLFLYETLSVEYVKRRYILFGMLIGACITLPIILSAQSPLIGVYEYIFSQMYMENIFQVILASIAILWFLHLLVSLIFWLFSKHAWVLRSCLKSFLLLSLLGVWVFGLYALAWLVWLWQQTALAEPRIIYGVVFWSFFSVIWYYLFVSFLEETGKYIGHLSQSGESSYTQSFSRFMIFSISLAIGFSFFENILYTWSVLERDGLHMWLVQLAFFRSLFSLSLHILCSILLSLGMWYFWQTMARGDYSIYLKKWYFFLLLSSVLAHSFFNVSLSFGYIGVVVLALVGLYFAVSYIIASLHSQEYTL